MDENGRAMKWHFQVSWVYVPYFEKFRYGGDLVGLFFRLDLPQYKAVSHRLGTDPMNGLLPKAMRSSDGLAINCNDTFYKPRDIFHPTSKKFMECLC